MIPLGCVASAQDIFVGGGSTADNTTATTYDSVTVEGTGSTYSAKAPLTLTGPNATIAAFNDGLFEVLAPVTATDPAAYAFASDGGRIRVAGNLTIPTGLFAASSDPGTLPSGRIVHESGVITANELVLSGTGTYDRSGGTYTLAMLTAADGATVPHDVGDSISVSAAIDGGATLDLRATLALAAGTLYLANGGQVSRTSALIDAGAVDVQSGSVLTTLAGDALGAVAIAAGGAIQVAGTTAITGATVNGVGSQFQVNAPLNVAAGGLVTVSDGGAVTTTAPISGIGLTLAVSGGAQGPGSVSLGADASFGGGVTVNGGSLALASGTLTTTTLSMTGSGAFARGGGSYAATDLVVGPGAEVDYSGGDVVTDNVSITGGKLSSAAKNLALANALQIDGGGTLSRTTGSVSAASLVVSGSSLFDIRAGDAFDVLTVQAGGTATAAAPLELVSLAIDNSGSLLELDSFAGSVGNLSWGLRLVGDWTTQLQSWLSGGRIAVSGNAQPAGVVYDIGSYGNATYVGYTSSTAIPEIDPASMTTVVALVSGVLGMFERRRTGRRRARP